jgi:site-specific DNA-methyltransferase (adenine-specific)
MTKARAKVLQGDALTLLADIEAGSVDAFIMDPPYCSGGFSEQQRRNSRGQGVCSERVGKVDYFAGDNMGTAGLVFLLRQIAFEACEKLRDGGSLLAFCDWRQVANIGPAIESSGLRWQNVVVWDKKHAGLGQGFRARHELCLHYTRGTGQYHDKRVGNLIEASRVHSSHRHHFAEKPIALLRQLVRVVTPPDGLVVDPFAGSGAIGCAAVLEGRRFLGFERDAEYCRIARERLQMAVADPHSLCRLDDREQLGLLDAVQRGKDGKETP